MTIQTTSTKCQYSAARSHVQVRLRPDTAAEGVEGYRQEPYDSQRYVGPVKARQREERRAEQVGPRRQPVLLLELLHAILAAVRKRLLEIREILHVQVGAVQVYLVVGEVSELENLEAPRRSCP